MTTQNASGRKFVMAIDATSASESRLQKLLSTKLVTAGDEVYLAHVLPDPYHEREELGMAASMSGGVNLEEPETPKQKFRQRITVAKTRIYDIFVPYLKAANVDYQIAILLTPSITKKIGEVLVKYADEAGADAIVIGKSDRGKLAELFLGSVSNVVVATSTNVPVIVMA